MKKIGLLLAILLITTTASAAMPEIPADQPYLEHLPTLPTLAQFEPPIAADPIEGIHPAQKMIDKNPLTRLGHAYGRLLGSLLSFGRISRGKYGLYLLHDADTAAANTTGILGDSLNDLSRTIDVGVAHHEGFVDDSGALQCTGALPFRGFQYVGGLSAITQLKHTWIEAGGRTYGMPYTLDHGYFGGDAVIQSPDGFQSENLEGVACVPLLRPEDETSSTFENRLLCMADKASTLAVGTRTRQLILSYDAIQDNCLAAVRFMTECAGGKISQVPNLDVGGSFDPDHVAKFRYKDDAVIRAYDGVFTALEVVDQALAKDLKANPGITLQQFIQIEAGPFAGLLQKLQQASQLIESGYPQRIQNDYSDEGGPRSEHWLRYTLENWTSMLQQAQDFSGLADSLFWVVQQASLDYPSVALTTVAGACQQIQNECPLPEN